LYNLERKASVEPMKTLPFLFNGGSVALHIGSYEELPEPVKQLAFGMLAGMGVIPTGDAMMSQILPMVM
jgi:hypothetical protein